MKRVLAICLSSILLVSCASPDGSSESNNVTESETNDSATSIRETTGTEPDESESEVSVKEVDEGSSTTTEVDAVKTKISGLTRIRSAM